MPGHWLGRGRRCEYGVHLEDSHAPRALLLVHTRQELLERFALRAGETLGVVAPPVVEELLRPCRLAAQEERLGQDAAAHPITTGVLQHHEVSALVVRDRADRTMQTVTATRRSVTSNIGAD